MGSDVEPRNLTPIARVLANQALRLEHAEAQTRDKGVFFFFFSEQFKSFIVKPS